MEQFRKKKTYAIDWDNTIVPNGCFPEIGEPKENAINVMQRIVDAGDRIIIWTCRGGEEQIQGIKDKLNENGFTDFIINENYQDVKDAFEGDSPKVYADVYIDDRALFTEKIDWYEIEKILFPEENHSYGDLFKRYSKKG